MHSESFNAFKNHTVNVPRRELIGLRTNVHILCFDKLKFTIQGIYLLVVL